jgi:energy-coupling factor transporter ATP-binding protein EcfA2
MTDTTTTDTTTTDTTTTDTTTTDTTTTDTTTTDTNTNTNTNTFQLPITYLTDKHLIKPHIKTDLELISLKGENSLYDNVFQPTTLYGKQTVPLWAEYYTANKTFLTDSQCLIKELNKKALNVKALNIKALNIKGDNITPVNEEAIAAIWQDIVSETGFVEKYHYMEWSRFKECNNSAVFLQILSLYNMTSPLLSLAVPIFFLIFPFILLKIQGIPIGINRYIEVLKTLFKQHQLGQIFTLGSASWDKVIYIVVSFGFYILQVYQNVTSCVKYYQNTRKIHEQLFTVREYVKQTLEHMSVLIALCEPLPTYQPFIADLQAQQMVLEHMDREFSEIVPNGLSVRKVKQIGHVMKCFYQLYNKPEYKAALAYSFGLHGYLANVHSLAQRYGEKQINACKMINSTDHKNDQNDKHKNKHNNKNQKKSHTKFTEAYFPTLLGSGTEPVKNTYTLDKHLLITGPNAAGKTTLLKTTIFNILFSQQTGFGFYKKAQLILYDHIHCYINIPDTSGRDSLFQAEARRCKDILTSLSAVATTSRENHLCVFDELYSGTNHYEAISSAYAFLSYLNKYSNVNFVLTTHYLDLCTRLDGQPGIKNVHMEVKEDEGEDFKYTYKLKKNVSTVKGGVKVLRDLDYPKEIIEQAMYTLKNTFDKSVAKP